MAAIVGVHGIAQQFKGAAILHEEWWPALQDGLGAAHRDLGDRTLVCAFYGGLFRPSGEVREAGETSFRAADVQDPFEQRLLQNWWAAAATAEPDRVVRPGAEVRRATPSTVQAGLRALSRSRFFAGLAESALIGDLKQVRRYLQEPSLRRAAQAAVHAVVTPETRVLVAHSLGSVVAYEALHRYATEANWANVQSLVTLGSPLGIDNLIFHALLPPPEGGTGLWPGLLRRWVNVSDDVDVVALVKRLGNLFPGGIVDMRIHNGAQAHDVRPYLTARETGAAIADQLS